MTTRSPKAFTGFHAAGILVLFFGVIVTVNFTMAGYASSTFGGVVVKNSYVASQNYNGWLQQAKEQKSWGWDVSSHWREDGRVAVTLGNVPGEAVIQGLARHPVGRAPETPLTFRKADDGTFISDQKLSANRWIVRLQVDAGEKTWRGEEKFR